MTQVHEITLHRYKVDELTELAAARTPLRLADAVEARVRKCEDFVAAKLQTDAYIYGVNTGFGALCERRVTEDQLGLLQYNHVVSHAAGVGESINPEVVRLMMIIKLLTFRAGVSGVSMATVDRVLAFLNDDIIPVVPKKGTLGASGDLAPLSHMALPLLGLGKVQYRGQIIDGDELLQIKGWQPLDLKPKEGLALTNGVQYLNALAAHALSRAGMLIRAADVIASLSTQAFSGSRTPFAKLYHSTTLHDERRAVARNVERLLEGSNHSKLPTCMKSMQDPYSFRCIPQVHGAVRQVFGFAENVIERECNGVSDNPLFFPDQDQILYGGALHGESSALAMDFLAIGLSELGSMSERRSYQLLSGCRGLPDFLVSQSGVNSGLMVVQYTAAALVNENKTYCMPASVDSIMSSQLQEDHVSMGGTSAYKLLNILDNLEYILGIELLTAAQACDLNRDLILSDATRAIHADFRQVVAFVDADRVMHPDVEAARRFVVEKARGWWRSLELE